MERAVRRWLFGVARDRGPRRVRRRWGNRAGDHVDGSALHDLNSRQNNDSTNDYDDNHDHTTDHNHYDDNGSGR